MNWTTEVLTRASQTMLIISFENVVRGSISFYEGEDELVERMKKTVEGLNEQA